MTIVTPLLVPPPPPPPSTVVGVVIELNAEDARELLSIIGNLSPGGRSDGWVSKLYKGLRSSLRIPEGELVPNTKFNLHGEM